VHRIKEIQKANREKQRESGTSEPVKAVYKPGKFDHVDSKVAHEIKVCKSLLCCKSFYSQHFLQCMLKTEKNTNLIF